MATRSLLRSPAAIAGFIFLGMAALPLAHDLYLWAARGVWAPMALGALWYEIDPGSLNLTQAAIQRYVSPAVWRPVFEVLLWPAWVLPGAIGMLVLGIGFWRRRS